MPDIATAFQIASNRTRKALERRKFFEKIERRAPDDSKPVPQVAYITGWHVNSEFLRGRIDDARGSGKALGSASARSCGTHTP